MFNHEISLAPKLRRESLGPNLPRRLIEAQSIGYLSGDLPFVTVDIEGNVIDLLPGQCIPTFGKRVTLTNRFAATGDVVMTYDYPPTMNANAALPNGLHDYRCSVTVENLTSGEKGGAGFRLEHGRALVTWQCDQTHGIDVILFRKATVANLEARPTSFMAQGEIQPVNTDGGNLPGLTTVSGEYTEAMAAQWVENANYAETPHQIATRTSSGQFVLNGGDALFFVRGFAEQYLEASFVLTDLGIYEHAHGV